MSSRGCSSSLGSNSSVQTISLSRSLYSITPCFQSSSGTFAVIGWPSFAQAVSPGSSFTHPDRISPADTWNRWVRSSKPQKSLRLLVLVRLTWNPGSTVLPFLTWYSRRISLPATSLPSTSTLSLMAPGSMVVAGLASRAVWFQRAMCSSRSTVCFAPAASRPSICATSGRSWSGRVMVY